MRKIKKFIAVALALSIIGGSISACGSSQSSKNSSAGPNMAVDKTKSNASDTINIAIQPSAAFIPLFVAKEEGWIDEAFKNKGITVNWNSFEAGPPMNESLAAGSSDVGFLGDVPAVSAIAAGQKNIIVATACQAPEAYALLVADASKIKSPKDLKGKTIGTVIGSTAHNLTKKILDTNGINIEDVNLANIAVGDASTVLSTGEVDAVAIWEPNVTRLVESGKAKVIGDGTKCNLLGVNPIVARADYADNNPEAIKLLIEQYARGVKALNDDKLDDSAIENIAEYLSLKPDQIKTAASKYKYTVKIAQEDIDGLNDTIQFLVDIDTLEKPYDISDYVKSEYTEGANLSQYID